VGTGTSELALTPTGLTSDGRRSIEPETAAWVRRARDGDGEAFALLMGRHERMVLRTALRLLGRLDLAQDAAQETFLRLHRYLHRVDETRELGPWLYRLVVNACHTLGRRSRVATLVSLEELDDLVGVRPASIEGLAERSQQLRLVHAALATLPERERAAIVLRDLEGLTSVEVARILGSSEGTVRSQVASARLKIKSFVEKQGRKA
jgi:RNA polymerase sigma-70 factor, ECF subfamily